MFVKIKKKKKCRFNDLLEATPCSTSAFALWLETGKKKNAAVRLFSCIHLGYSAGVEHCV